jgi:hypothetical protein
VTGPRWPSVTKGRLEAKPIFSLENRSKTVCFAIP